MAGPRGGTASPGGLRPGTEVGSRRVSWQTFWLFVTVTFFVSATPGPNMLLVMSSSARFGFEASLA